MHGEIPRKSGPDKAVRPGIEPFGGLARPIPQTAVEQAEIQGRAMLNHFTRAVSALAVVAAAAGAITVLHGAGDSVSANAPLNSGKGDRLDIRAVGPQCSQQAWPYYEVACVKDRRQAMSRAKPARIVTPDRVPVVLPN
jgi:hypothetical protein